MTQQIRGAIFYNMLTITLDMIQTTFKEHQNMYPR